MRSSRIGPATFAAALLVCLIAALWTFALPVEAPGVQVQDTVFDPLPELAEENPPSTEPTPPPASHEWRRVTGSPEFPAGRVRPKTPPSFPDELYLNNRLLLKQVTLETNGTQMRVSGDVITDFIVDRAPRSSGLPQGQLIGLQVGIALFQYDRIVGRDPGTGRLIKPRVRPKEWGSLVYRQAQVVTVLDLWQTFGIAHFELPPLDKPLAPGLYGLEATLNFRRQPVTQQDALFWCSSLYGARVGTLVDPATMESETQYTNVLDDPAIHREVYKDMVENVEQVQDSATLLVGDLRLTPKLADNLSCHTCIETSYHQLIRAVGDYEYQLDNVERIVADDLKNKLSLKGITGEQRRKWLRESFEDRRRIRGNSAELINRAGGRTTTHEKLTLQALDERCLVVLQQLAEFQDRLILHYWILLDGLLLYRGWHSTNQPGYGAWEAITGNGNSCSRAARKQRLAEARDSGGLQARWDHRRDAWKYYPDEITDIAFAYLRTKEETGDWDPENFILTTNARTRLNVEAWSSFRHQQTTGFLAAYNAELEQVQTTHHYANQALQRVYNTLQQARDDVLALAWSWEYYLRVEVQSEDPVKVKEHWESFPEGVVGRKKFEEQAERAPGTRKARFDERIRSAKQQLRLGDFIQRWRIAIDAGQTPPGR